MRLDVSVWSYRESRDACVSVSRLSLSLSLSLENRLMLTVRSDISVLLYFTLP